MRLVTSTGFFGLEKSWKPDAIFDYTSAGRIERENGESKAFFYSDNLPVPSGIRLTMRHAFDSRQELYEYISSVTKAAKNVTAFEYFGTSITIQKAFLDWRFGPTGRQLEATLTLLPYNSNDWEWI